MVGFEPQALGLRFGDPLVQILQFLDRDILPVFQTHCLRLFFVTLQRLLGFLEFHFQSLGFFDQELPGDLRRTRPHFHVLADEFPDDGVRDRLRQFGLFVFGDDVDQPRAGPDFCSHFSSKFSAAAGQIAFLCDAIKQGQAHEVLLDGFDELTALQLLRINLLNVQHLLPPLLDLDDFARCEDARAAGDESAPKSAPSNDADDDQPRFFEQDVDDFLEVDSIQCGGGNQFLFHGLKNAFTDCNGVAGQDEKWLAA